MANPARATVKILEYPETRQVYDFDCGANSLLSMLVFAGIEPREDRIIRLAKTTEADGTDTEHVRFVLGYYGQPVKAGEGMTPNDLRRAIDAGHPTMITLQAYPEDTKIPWDQMWDQGHWVVAIGYDENRIIFEDPASFHRTWLPDGELIARWHDLDSVKVKKPKKIIGWGCTLLVTGVYKNDRMDHMD